MILLVYMIIVLLCTDSIRMRQANTQRPHRSSGQLGQTPTPGAAALHAPLPIPRCLLSGRRKFVRPQGRRWQGMPLLPPLHALLSGGPVHGDNSDGRCSAVGSTHVGQDPLTQPPDLLPQGLRTMGLCGCGGAALCQRVGRHPPGYAHGRGRPPRVGAR